MKFADTVDMDKIPDEFENSIDWLFMKLADKRHMEIISNELKKKLCKSDY